MTLICTLPVLGQDVTFVSDFELLEVENGVFVNWQIDSGYTCQGVDILRSEDGASFAEVGHISGVCGSLTKPVRYSFLDADPIPNSTNYYRLKLNGFGYTEILTIYYFELPESGLLLYPNPTVEGQSVSIKFSNENNEEVTVEVIGADGRIYFSEVTTESNLSLAHGILKKGVYQVVIRQGQQQTERTNKLVVH